jgi:putative lipoic acid-binding regulatory protein
VLIARQEAAFEARLEALLLELLPGGAPGIRRRASSDGRFVSIRLDVHMSSAQQALTIRERLAALDGVVLLL